MGVQPATEGPPISRDNPGHVLGGQLLPTIRTQTEAQAAHAALVHQIFSALRSALVPRLGNPGRALTHRQAKPGTRPHEHARRHHRDRRTPPITAHACPAGCDRSPAVKGHHTGGYPHPLSFGDWPEDQPRTEGALRPI